MTKPVPEPKDVVIDAMMDVVARDGWLAATLAAVAAEAGQPIADVAALFGNRFNILAAFGRRADLAALKEAEDEGGSQAVRDRLFAILMARFDALAPFKSAVQRLAKASRTDPGLAAFFLRQLPCSLALVAEAAGVSSTGWFGMARVKALSVLYIGVTRTWLADDSPDLSKTMAALDQALARADRWESQVARLCRQSGTIKPEQAV
jgi:ubiquinone biosynthesis protein COQ9